MRESDSTTCLSSKWSVSRKWMAALLPMSKRCSAIRSGRFEINLRPSYPAGGTRNSNPNEFGRGFVIPECHSCTATVGVEEVSELM